METKELISEYRRNPATCSNHTNTARPVRCIETGEVWGSVLAVSQSLNASYSSIYGCCTGRQKSAYGLHFEWANKE